MSEKDNDINRLAERQRILARLRGERLSLPRIAEQVVPMAPRSEPTAAVAVESGNNDEAPAVASERPVEAPTGHQGAIVVRAPVAAPARPLAASARAVPTIGAVSQRARPSDLLGIYLASRGSPRSRRTMSQALERCARIIGTPVETVAWHELRVEHTQAIRGALISAGYGKATIGSTLTALRGILRYAKTLGFMSRDDYANAIELDKIVGESVLAGRVLSREEIAKLRAYCESEGDAYGAFLAASFALLLGVGLRAHEACTMPLVGYSPVDRVVRLRRKRNKEAALPVDRRAAASLDAWLPIRQALQKRAAVDTFLVRVQRNGWVRPQTAQMQGRTLEYVLAQAGEAAGVAHFTPHDLRRTFCTMMLDAGKDTLTVAGLMSHEDPKTTAKYDRRGEQARAKAREDVEIW